MTTRAGCIPGRAEHAAFFGAKQVSAERRTRRLLLVRGRSPRVAGRDARRLAQTARATASKAQNAGTTPSCSSSGFGARLDLRE